MHIALFSSFLLMETAKYEEHIIEAEEGEGLSALGIESQREKAYSDMAQRVKQQASWED